MSTWQILKKHPGNWQKFWLREQVLDGVRAYFKSVGFHEVETPELVYTPSTEPFLEVFETSLLIGEETPRRAFLISSPEYAMKKLVAAGSGSIFQICKSFRNGEGRSPRHNGEFSILEWYHVEATYLDVLTDFESMVKEIFHRVHPETVTTHQYKLSYQGKNYNLSSPWEKITVAEAFRRFVGIDVETLLSETKLLEVGRQKGYQITSDTTWEQVFHQLLMNEIEPFLGMVVPTVLMDYPAVLCPLCQTTPDDERFAQRFEVYLAGLELGNAFGELTDPVKQKANCLADLAERRKLGKTEYPLDEEFIAALESGMPTTSGIAVGLDRVVMLFADAASLQEVMFFPHEEMFG